MKKISKYLSLLLFILFAANAANGQETTIFWETCGTTAPTSGTRPIPSAYTGWDNGTPVAFSGNSDVRATNNINSHVWFAANSSKNLIISGINTSGKTNLKLSFDVACNVNNGNANALFIDVKDLVTNAESSITVPSTSIPNLNVYITVSDLEGLPATNNLQITFYATAASNPNGYGYRLDNIEITGEGSSNVDTIAPVLTFDPLSGATNVSVSTAVTITSNEPLRKTDNSAIADSDLSTLVVFKETDASGTAVP
ncbi:MAG: hypothetical protein LBS69_08655, partial [Prevotellaceae bacterium]|nr:hypothetical protein [Prevotellaceae bacterium]